jgi:hypothetical protein
MGKIKNTGACECGDERTGSTGERARGNGGRLEQPFFRFGCHIDQISKNLVAHSIHFSTIIKCHLNTFDSKLNPNMELELIDTETKVGPYRADLLCWDTNTDSYVLIETLLKIALFHSQKLLLNYYTQNYILPKLIGSRFRVQRWYR